MRLTAKLVLIVNANAEVGQLIAILAKHQGHRAQVVASVERALREINDNPVDLLICDVSLGEGGCDRLAEAAQSRRPEIPVIVLTDQLRPLSSTLRGDYCFEVDRFDYQRLRQALLALLSEPEN